MAKAGKDHRPGRRVQLHRALSKLGWGSRTQALNWIRAGEVRAAEVRVGEVRVGQDRAGEDRAGEVPLEGEGRAGEVRAGEVRAAEVKSSDVPFYVSTPDHSEGGLNVGPCRSFLVTALRCEPAVQPSP